MVKPCGGKFGPQSAIDERMNNMPLRIHVIITLILAASAPAVADLPIEATDALGDRITLNAYPERIVSLAPSNTEILFALGAGDRIVAVTNYCDYPPEVEHLPRIGGFSDASLELIVSVQPDLVVAARLNPLEALESLKRFDIPVFVLAPSTLEETIRVIRQTGRLIGEEDATSRLIKQLESRIEAVRKIVSAIGQEDRPRVIWGRLAAPFYSAGPGSFIDDLIRAAGGVNIIGSGNTWPQIGLETVVDRNPEVIIVSVESPESIPKDIARLRETSGWKTIDAVKTGRIYHLDLDLLGRPGPRLVDGLERLAALLHPGRFKK